MELSTLRKHAGLVCLAMCSLGSPAAAQLVETVELVPLDPTHGADFGQSVAISGDLAVIGSPWDDDLGSRSGSAYVFDLVSSQQLVKLLANDGAAFDEFGVAVAIDGNIVLVGADKSDQVGSNTGSAYLFDANTGVQLARLLPGDGGSQDGFGVSVALGGGYALVGAFRHDGQVAGSGAAYVFDVATGTQLAKLLAQDTGPGELFGCRVDMDGTRAVIGASAHMHSSSINGAAYVLDIATSTYDWELLASDGASYDSFGWPVALSGNSIWVGAPADDDMGNYSGSVYVYDLATGSEQAKLLAQDGFVNDRFGKALDVDGGLAVVGVYLDDDHGTNSGSAYLYDSGSFAAITKLTASDGDGGDLFGSSVAIEGSVVLVGTPNDYYNVNLVRSGSVYLFNLDCDDNGVLDYVQISQDASLDLNLDGRIDACECSATVQCLGLPNSTGAVAQLTTSGSYSLAVNALSLHVSSAAPKQLGLVLYGAPGPALPFGDGLLCQTAPRAKVGPAVKPDASGALTIHLDLSQGAPASGPAAILAFSDWVFQFVYRDPSGGGQGFNITSALRVRFCP
ncbi:MAG: FG-GAP repeat protein [bacterium]|nr:hypothetical protein [Planctomycetota bacterium]